VRRPDQSSQFTSVAFSGALLNHGVSISMDGKGSRRDNVFVERLWRSVKYEEVCLKAYDNVSQAHLPRRLPPGGDKAEGSTACAQQPHPQRPPRRSNCLTG
jgi:hypothetical protein